MMGRYQEALAVMRETPDPRGSNDLLLALAGTGRTEEALTLADSLLALNDTSFVWDSVVSALGRQDPLAASGLVDRLQRDAAPAPELTARRLYDDALRLVPVDMAKAKARLVQAAGIPGRTDSGERARLRLLRASLGAVRTLDELAPLGDSLSALASRPSGAASEAAALEGTLSRLRVLQDSGGAGVPQGDLRPFLGAEAARDTLAAPALAAGLFRRISDEWPASPYAPKALLAAERLDPSDTEASRAKLDSLYADSPYLAVARGEDPQGYQVLEDSLQ